MSQIRQFDRTTYVIGFADVYDSAMLSKFMMAGANATTEQSTALKFISCASKGKYWSFQKFYHVKVTLIDVVCLICRPFAGAKTAEDGSNG